jgi:diadenylate cyclase
MFWESWTSLARRIGEVLRDPWSPLIEIAFIAAVIYLVLRFIQGTRAASLARGFIILFLAVSVVALTLAQAFQLLRLVQVLQTLLAGVALLVIVIFQPEIRRVLLRIGRNPFAELFGRERNPMLREIISAVAVLSRDRVGALIAIQRETGLRGYIEGGTPLEAAVSAGLLTTIFQPGTALHDGAVVIREGRVAAAGCLFPLSENPEKSSRFGTRHRAALGLAEETDAAVIVVSEETGAISLALDGNIDTDLTLERLTSRLTRLMSTHRADHRVSTQTILETLDTQPLDELPGPGRRADEA